MFVTVYKYEQIVWVYTYIPKTYVTNVPNVCHDYALSCNNTVGESKEFDFSPTVLLTKCLDGLSFFTLKFEIDMLFIYI